MIGGELDYDQLRERVHRAVSLATAPGSTVLVVSRGDGGLVDLEDRRGWHFPRDLVGRHSGHSLPHSAAAVAHVEQLRAGGADYLVFPATELWWLEYYAELSWHLETSYRTIRDDACLIFDLRTTEERDNGFLASLGSFLASLTPPGATIAVVASEDEPLPALEDRSVERFPSPASAKREKDSLDAPALIEELERLRESGRDFLVIPSTTALPLEEPFVRSLEERYLRVARQTHLCSVYELVARDGVAEPRGLAAKLSNAWSAATRGRRLRAPDESPRWPSDA
jgi:hypothetical protein